MPGLHRLARELHDKPELSGREHESARRVAGVLAGEGFQVDHGAGGFDTAFVARRDLGGPGPVIAYLAEYDALPVVGHGCGHNLIAAAAVGAGLVLAATARDLAGQVRVIGTPAEETVGGKVILVGAGVFDDVDVALMVHPGHEDRVLSDSLACASFEVIYTGRAAHAVAHPEKGINALDALLGLFAARDILLRRSVPGARIVGVITEGGVRPNIVPERTAARFSLRAPCRDLLESLVAEFRHLAEGVASTWRCEVEVTQTDRTYDEMLSNEPLADAYRENLRVLGVEVNDRPRRNKGSLDMGNVSYAIPSLHPFFAIVPPEIASHTREFGAATLSAAGREGLLRSVKALAMTGLDVLLDADLLERARGSHRQARQRSGAAGERPA